MKNIIIPFDFSEQAENGVILGCELSNMFGADVTLIYVQKDQRELAHLSHDEEKTKAQKELEACIAKYKPRLTKGQTVNGVVRVGKVYREIVNLASELEDSYIVISTHGASGFEELFIGTNVMRVIAATTHTIFAIHHGVIPQPIKRIIFPLDTTNESRQKAPEVAKLATDTGAEVHILVIVETPNDEVNLKIANYQRQIEEYFTDRNVKFTTTKITGKETVDVTMEYAKEKDGQLIAITSRDKVSPKFLMVGGKVQRLLSKSPVPVMVVAPTAEPIMDSFRASASW